MLKYSSKLSVNVDKAASPGVTVEESDTVSYNGGNFKLRASKTESAVIKGLSFKDLNARSQLNDFVLAIEKPGSFLLDYNIPKNDVRLQFTRKINVANRTLNWTTSGGTRNSWGASLDINPSTRVSFNNATGGKMKLKCRYIYSESLQFEPSYNLDTNALKVGASYKQRVENMDVLFRATYKSSTDKIGLELTQTIESDGSLKISACIDTANMWKMPKLFFSFEHYMEIGI